VSDASLVKVGAAAVNVPWSKSSGAAYTACVIVPCQAAGLPVAWLTKRAIRPPAWLAAAEPADTVLEVALHADGYEAFRLLRQWAWDKGYVVNWVPHDGDSIILSRVEHVYAQ